MSHLNQLQMSREIKNLKLIVSRLNQEMDEIKNTNINIYSELNSIKTDIKNNHTNIDMNYIHQDELVGFLDDIKHDILELNKKIDNVSSLTNKTILISSDDKLEIYNFLKNNNIDRKYINIILAMDVNSIEEIILINKEDLYSEFQMAVEDILIFAKYLLSNLFKQLVTMF